MKILTRFFGFYFNILSLVAPSRSAKQAFYLFCIPFKAKLKPHQQDFLNTADTFKLKVDKKNVQYYSWGKGQEKILFTHGWQSNSYRWKTLIEQFDKTKYTLIAFDAPGHGNSESKIGNIPLFEKSIESLIKHIGDIDHFVGHSIGSFACASFAFHSQYPMKSFTSLATPFDAHEFFYQFNNQLKTSKRLQKHMKVYFEKYTGYPVEHYSLETFSTILNPDRTLIIHDKQDKSTSPKSSQRLFELLKTKNSNVELTLTEGLRHNLRGKKIVDAVEAFVNKTTLNA